ncbi:MAG: hypothetical protein AB7F35_27420 [Acetobacteraceae bacterium]
MTDTSTKKTISSLYFVKEDPKGGKNSKGYWSRIGTAVHHEDGKSMTLMFDVPIVITTDTRLTVRDREEREKA